MDNKERAALIKRYRKDAKNEKLPQEVRNEYLDRAVELEQDAYDESPKMGMAKGGAVKKMAYGGDTSMKKPMGMAKGGAVKKMAYGGDTSMKKPMGMAKGGAVKKMAYGGDTSMKKPMGMAKGGMAMCGASVPASKGKK